MTLAGRQKAVRGKKKTAQQVILTPAMLPALADRKTFANFWSLSVNQMQFVLHYCVGPCKGNATASYHLAGYQCATTSANACAASVKHKPRVQAAIREVLSVAGCGPEFIVEKWNQQANPPDMADLQPFFEGKKTLAELRDEGVNTAALQKVQITRDTKGNETRRAELPNPVPVLRLGGEFTGMIKQHRVVEQLNTIRVENLSPGELQRYERALRAVDAEFELSGDGRGASGEVAGLLEGGEGHITVEAPVGAGKE